MKKTKNMCTCELSKKKKKKSEIVRELLHMSSHIKPLTSQETFWTCSLYCSRLFKHLMIRQEAGT